MKVLDDAAVQNGNALPLGLGGFERLDLAAGKVDLVLGRREGRVRNGQLRRDDVRVRGRLRTAVDDLC